MSKKLKLFGLLALTLALGAGAAWAFGLKTIVTTDNNTYDTTIVVTSVLVGSGTKGVVTGSFRFGGAAGAPTHVIQLKAAAKDDIFTVAPTTGKEIKDATAAPGKGGQIVVNYDSDLTSELGMVVLKSGNEENPDATHENVDRRAHV